MQHSRRSSSRRGGIASVRQIAAKAKAICPEFGVKKLELFGSHARRSATSRSDIDLIATFDETPGLGLIALQRALEIRLGRRVDLFEAKTIAEMRNPYRRAEIEADRTTIYEA